VVEVGGRVLKGLHPPREEEEGEDPCGSKDHSDLQCWRFAQEQEEICDFVQHSHPGFKHNHQEEGVSGRGAEVLTVNRVPVEELDELLQAPEAALQTAQQELCKLILGDCERQRDRQVSEHEDPDDLDDGEDEGMHPIVLHTPERPPQGRKHREGGHVIWFDKGPVVGGEGPGQGHLSQSRDEVGTPEEEEDVVELQADQVFVVNCLSSVKGKQALGVGALRLHRTGREGEERVEQGTHHVSDSPETTTRRH
uniref:Uncharacterized protein n=1 Tax=Mastacembelus armatus TaxID=205130 RepID=A0A3Q3LZW6_9TELE